MDGATLCELALAKNLKSINMVKTLHQCKVEGQVKLLLDLERKQEEAEKEDEKAKKMRLDGIAKRVAEEIKRKTPARDIKEDIGRSIYIKSESQEFGIDESVVDRLIEEAAQMVKNHAMSALIFLVDAPTKSQPLDHIRAMCRVAWSYLDAGAAGMGFPEGRTVWTRRQLAEVNPDQIYGSHSQIFVSSHFAGPAVSSRRWVRTFGMHQFGLSDIACSVTPDDETNLNAAEKLMTMVPPYLIELGENIADGDTIEVEDSLWRVSMPESNDPSLHSPAGINVYTIDESIVA